MRIGIDCRKIADFGIGSYVRGLIHGLASLEGDEEYVAFVPSFARELVPPRFRTVIADVPNYSVRELLTLGRLADRAALDLFHSPHFVLPLTSTPAVVTLHDLILFHYPPRNPIGWAYVVAMTSRAARRAVKILTVSEAAKAAIVAALDAPAEKIVVTPNGIDDVFFREASPATTHAPYFLYAGNDKPHKNVDRLVEAFERSGTAMRLVLAGAPFERFRSRERVVCAGFVSVDELASLYRGASAVLLPSLEEGFGLPAAEAMACGAPVVTSNHAALVEVTGDAALHVDPRSVDAITAALRRVARDAALRDELSQRGRRRASAYTWRRCAELTRAAYRSVVAGSGAAGEASAR